MWQWHHIYCHRVWYQIARVAEHLVSKYHEDWSIFHWLTSDLWLFIMYCDVHWGYEERMKGIWSKKNGQTNEKQSLPFVSFTWFSGSSFKWSFQDKNSFIQLHYPLCGSLQLHYCHHVKISNRWLIYVQKFIDEFGTDVQPVFMMQNPWVK